MKLQAIYATDGAIRVYDMERSKHQDRSNHVDCNEINVKDFCDALDALRANTLDPEVHRMVAEQIRHYQLRFSK